MQSVELTFGRAFKVWWSYSWRAFVLALLVLVPLEIVMLWYMMSHFPKQGANPAETARVAATMAAAWPIVMVVVIALQAQAMRRAVVLEATNCTWAYYAAAILSQRSEQPCTCPGPAQPDQEQHGCDKGLERRSNTW